ncbi:MAG TPA: hypothetical protein VGZ02_03200 [Candidatus Baltobacteraceae bacterium]|nr:hypothetical protein [Candidatus Baltobacteraceae bacterium]
MKRYFALVFCLAVGLHACSAGSAPVPSDVSAGKNQPVSVVPGQASIALDANTVIDHQTTLHIMRPPGFSRIHGSSASCPGCYQPPLKYFNGYVQSNFANVFIDFWGWGTNTNSAYAANLINFVKSIGLSPWLQTVTQYSNAGNGPGMFIGSWYDNTSSPPDPLGLGPLQNEAQTAQLHFGFPENAEYIIVLPPGRDDYRFVSGNACAWHADYNSGTGHIEFISLDFNADNPVCSPDGLLGTETIIAGHEIAETETDAQFNGWNDGTAGDNEIGDKCAWYRVANETFPNGQSFDVQSLWSNSASGSDTAQTNCVDTTTEPPPCSIDSLGNCASDRGVISTTHCQIQGLPGFLYTQVTQYWIFKRSAYGGYVYLEAANNTVGTNCTTKQPINTWSPGEPKVQYNDPNLP